MSINQAIGDSYRMTALHVGAGGVITAVLFALLPFVESLARPDAPTLWLRDVTVANWTPPPVPEPPRLLTTPAMPSLPSPAWRPAPVSMPAELPPRPLDITLPALPAALGFAVALTDLPAATDLVFDLADADVPPVPLAQMPPLYPAHARFTRTEGSVLLEFVVTRDGRTSAIRIMASDPPGVFDAAARQAAAKWRFRPATRGDEPAAVRVRQRLTFTLEPERRP